MELIGNKDILFIINLNAGKSSTKRIISELNSQSPEIPYVLTKDLYELEEVFTSNMEKVKAFIVVGGDGTVRAALKYLYNEEDKLLGVLPTGSGNGFSRELGFKSSIKTLIDDTKKGQYLDIDILKLNNNLCVNIAGLGIDSHIAHLFQKSKTRGLRNYIISTIRSIITFKPIQATVIFDQQKIEGKFLMITIANTRQFGNNAIISPMSKPNDGLFELVLVKPIPMLLYPVFLTRMFLGKLNQCRYISYIQIKGSVKIISRFNRYHADGDPMTFSESLSIEMLTEKIRVIQTNAFRSRS